jgi:uncharacterized flavoprotein (TIGR03862 family)
MAATVLARAGHRVRLLEKKRGTGRKLLIAGSSGLNITYECASVDELARHYGESAGRLRSALLGLTPADWRAFIEESLGIGTFLGTSRRYFVEGMKAPELLKAWASELRRLDVSVETDAELTGFEPMEQGGIRIATASASGETSESAVDALILCLGGGSWEPSEKPLRWPAILRERGIEMRPFRSSNCGFRVAWPAALLSEAEGRPIKNVVLRSPRGERSGDLVITSYGIEGTPVYFAGESGPATLDLEPDLSEAQLLTRLRAVKENLSPMRRVKRQLNLSDGALALVFHLAPAEDRADLAKLARLLKAFPLELGERQPLDEAISSSGGVAWSELDDSLMLRRYPGVFAAGEMIDWDAPTGGFLIQACVSLGHAAARGALALLEARGRLG